MGQEIGRQIGAAIGEVEMVDTDEEGAAWGEFLRARIKVDLTKPLLRGRRLKVQGKSIWARFQYEQLPRFCFTCGVIKHGKGGCLKRMSSKMKIGEPEYGPWLRAPSPTRRFRNIFNSGSGCRSPHQQEQRWSMERRSASETESDGVESSAQGGRQSQIEAENGARSLTPVNSMQVMAGIATGRGSVNSENHNVTQGTMRERESMECIYDPGRAHARSLTTDKGNILSNRQQKKQRVKKPRGVRKGILEWWAALNTVWGI
jgi:hypothetical protein